ncbi:sensor domain-containing diguanylate cyclase [Mycolicibacterium duvalii]|uniref:Uncharacterized protein n=1 Tax=Mycolicibacterium duvalii TaxID=39688 RepID=A0A7I7K0A5_9MYCO|nr:diguanylate cyclase [Mycolicibacterium duvalii]MCV7368678.1 diguanylate cyclase [Mycolicibacterium duvalii]PEG35623.1 sensor domain-containing diguanylate cyclase [Mycolicibacterium duvalii]BBX16949.1 hypothetical protein MDUV_18090 [Mycolicibacterium duvalii]
MGTSSNGEVVDRTLRSAMTFVAFPVAYALAVAAGRATRLAGGEVSLAWPAAAVGVIWLLSVRQSGAWKRGVHVALLGVVSFTTNIATGASVPLSVWFVLVNLVLSVVTVELLAYRRDDVVLRDPTDLARLVAAVTVGTCCAAVLAAGWFVVVTSATVWETFGLFAVRNGATALLGVAIWLRLRDVSWSRPHITAAAVFEMVLAAVGIVAIFFWIFWLLNTGLPLAFLALVPVMWLALRYSTTLNTLFLTAAGAWIIYATLSNKGVFIVPEIQTRALLAQAMVASLTLIVLTLSLYRDSRARLITELEHARDKADEDSELLTAVLDSIHDSVVVVDGTGSIVLQNARAADSGLVEDVVTASSADGFAAAAPASNAPRDVVIAADGSRVVELTTALLARQMTMNVMAFRDVTDERENARALREARDLFAGVLDAASEQAIIGTDPRGNITVFNHGAERMLGWTEAEVLGRKSFNFHYQPEVRARAEELGVRPIDVFVYNVTPEQAEVREWTYVRKDGSHVAVSVAISQMTGEDGSCEGFIGVATDITERKAAEQALAASEEQFRLAFDTAPMGMFMFTIAPEAPGRITRCNQAFADFLGRPGDDVLTMTVFGLPGDGTDRVDTGLDPLLTLGGGQRFERDVAFRRADGTEVWGAVSASVVAPDGSEPYGICLVEDITSRKRVEAELVHLASHDPLTGLANRALLTDRIQHALAEVDAGISSGVGMISLDLDGFKEINDTWGHAEGDEVLVEVGERIRAAVRSTDTTARLGGDEFAVLCPGLPDVAELQALAERIRAQVRRPFTLSGGEVYDRLSVSAGVVTSRGACDAGTLLRKADTLMYHAKRSGKDCVVMA